MFYKEAYNMKNKENNKNRSVFIGGSIIAFCVIVFFIAINSGDTSEKNSNSSSVSNSNSATAVKATIEGNSQAVEINVLPSSFTPIVVQKGIPVKFNLKVLSSNLTGCNNGIKINDFNIDVDLKEGDNIVEFIPNESGTFTYTCWMGMITSTITVVDDLKNVNPDIINSINETQKSNTGSTCGCAGGGN